ncbi:MAG: hypothetical protein JXB40_01160 [Candidatus Omnitrophica bacterium]|nr:hypothetical protein [Candidatus Omnitrophota bacterium]
MLSKVTGIIFAACFALLCGAAAFAQDAERTPARLAKDKISISVGAPNGSIAPLLGVNAGPSPAGAKGNAELTVEYQVAGVTMVRTHDYYGPFDLSVIYPDINADPLKPESYDFTQTDKIFDSIRDGGFEPYLRLGDSYNNVRIPRNERELMNLSAAAVEVARRYIEKSCDGLGPEIRYVEIWNEPDFKRFWPGDFDMFLLFFTETFSKLKKEFPKIKVGGPGFVVSTYKVPEQRAVAGHFFDYLRIRGIIPDFISFHMYSNDPAEYYDAALFYRDAALKAGIKKAKIHITEWNTEREGHGRNITFGREAAPRITAIWIALQEAGVDASLIYRGNDTNIDKPDFYGIFTADGREKPAAKTFTLWEEMTRYPRRCIVQTGVSLIDRVPSVKGELSPLWILAGDNGKGDCALLIANIGDQELRCTLDAGPSPIESLSITEILGPDADTSSRTVSGDRLLVAPFSVQLVKFEASHAKGSIHMLDYDDSLVTS